MQLILRQMIGYKGVMENHSPSKAIAVSNIIHDFADGYRSLKNLHEYHPAQMKLFSEIAGGIEHRLQKSRLSEEFDFETDVTAAEDHLVQLNRMLGGGSLSAWLQADEAQDILGLIQWDLSRYQTSNWDTHRDTARKCLKNSIKQDDKARRHKIDGLTEKFRSPPKFWWSPAKELKKLMPPIRVDAASTYDPRSIFHSFLQKFLSPPPRDHIERNGIPQTIPVHVVRKPSGDIITMIPGRLDSPTQVFEYYCPKLIDGSDFSASNKLPTLYKPAKHCDATYRDQFVAAMQYLARRPNTMKLVPWTEGGGALGGSDIYLAEIFRQKIFILATVLGPNEQLEVIVPFTWTHSDATVKKAIEQTCEGWSSEANWRECEAQYNIKCTSLCRYQHQLLVPGSRQTTKCRNLSRVAQLRFHD
ncbi:hypothetical protein B0H14DRAFT_2569177 [Mycena olivaceomarginata]|nr:hypothetical protein B0H14DRAFT_2569177 [Mycena olivaceomarginata]